MAIEDLIESPKISRLQARKVHTLLQHHMVHHSYPEKIMPQISYQPNTSKVPLQSKQAKDLPVFSGKIPDWLKWKEKATPVPGHNQRLTVATHGTVTEDPESQAINNALHWSILQAVKFGQVQHRVKMHESSDFGHPNGNGDWKSLIDSFETRESNELIAFLIERTIYDIAYTDADTQTIGGFIDRFNGLIYEHTKYVGTVLYPPARQFSYVHHGHHQGNKSFDHTGYCLHSEVDAGIPTGATPYQRGPIKSP